jgi:hypothetical protein
MLGSRCACGWAPVGEHQRRRPGWAIRSGHGCSSRRRGAGIGPGIEETAPSGPAGRVCARPGCRAGSARPGRARWRPAGPASSLRSTGGDATRVVPGRGPAARRTRSRRTCAGWVGWSADRTRGRRPATARRAKRCHVSSRVPPRQEVESGRTPSTLTCAPRQPSDLAVCPPALHGDSPGQRAGVQVRVHVFVQGCADRRQGHAWAPLPVEGECAGSVVDSPLSAGGKGGPDRALVVG